ncbi:adhesion G protein-coupled receptor E5 isoform X2 [Pleurodeles waltl]|uniref:adhesion G protein-coupled receptor E5 isoform X2 n=1 Tax=Pleurodeles waltl TaxID=8319 RepID=UPI00370963CA
MPQGICFLCHGRGARVETPPCPTKATVDCGNDCKCPKNSVCNATSSDYCTCKPGFFHKETNTFEWSKGSCDDINECLPGATRICGPGTICINTPGSYYCQCLTGYEPESGKQKFQNLTEEKCKGIGEGGKNTTIRCFYEKCINTSVGCMCKCPPGYGKSSKDPHKICKDIDECRTNASICGPNAKCTNKPGDYTCKCDEKSVPSTGFGDWTNQTSCLRINCRSPAASHTSTPCPQTNALLCDLAEIIASVEPECGALKDQEKKSTEAVQTLLNGIEKLLKTSEWMNIEQMNIKTRHHMATEMLQSIEAALKNLALVLPQRTSFLSNNGSFVEVWKSSDRKVEDITILGNKIRMSLDRRAAIGKRDEGIVIVGMFSFHNMRTFLSEAPFIEGRQESPSQTPKEDVKYNVISEVVTAFVSNEQPYNLKTPIKFTFEIEKKGEKKDAICSYRKIVGNTSFWSTEGCHLTDSNGQRVTCECNHLSSFAVLMAQYPVKSWSLEIITKVGLAISLICLLFAIVTFMFCRSLKGTRNTIHLHLCISLFLANAIFLAGITRVDNELACKIVAGLLHYFFLASFCWMCLEGVELYLMVVKVFKTNAMKQRYMLLAGYGVPLVVVAISAATRSSGYGTRDHCWLSLEHGFIWSFLAPVCIIILLNAIIFIITVYKLAKKFSTINPDISQLKKFRTFTITAIAQLCLLGCTWIVGIFQFNQHTLFVSYLFTILNCLQGTFIFVLHCLMKKQVREEYKRWFCAAINLKTPSTYDKFSSTGAFSSSSSQSRALRPIKESGM